MTLAFFKLILSKRSFHFNMYDLQRIYGRHAWRKAIHESDYQGPVSVHDFVTKLISELEISEDKTRWNPLVTVQMHPPGGDDET